eukprot:TRINITY_DN17332_c0_g1_i1.p1 TRINITY_DN17332_c0_g1~~TRINITY_DN17332_c0_g1_i1.p1  ORF type:complete len:334 (-),score=63.73 TRINITY_DN17332_c0_g1_i1:149-1150(-)
MQSSDLFFLQADLRNYLEDEDESEWREKADRIITTYLTDEIVKKRAKFAIAPEIEEKLNSAVRGSIEQRKILQEILTAITTQIQKKYNFAGIVRGTIDATIYQKRYVGQAELPLYIHERVRNEMDFTHSRWKLKYDNACQVYLDMKAQSGTFAFLQTVVVNVPMNLAVDIAQFRHASQQDKVGLNHLVSREVLEDIGPMSAINRSTFKKPFFFMKKIDMVAFHGARFMEDGTYVDISTSVEHPKAPLSERKYRRADVIWGGLMITPLADSQIRLTFCSVMKAGKLLKVVMESVASGKHALIVKEQMEDAYKASLEKRNWIVDVAKHHENIGNL